MTSSLVYMIRDNLARAHEWPERIATLPGRWSYQLGLRSTAGMTLPHFLCIGGQKCGSTWLNDNLAAHPQIYLPPERQVNYFNRAIHRPLSFYAERFEAGRDRIRGEVNPGYSIMSIRRVAYARRLLPDLKIVYLLRNPIERAWSQAVMNFTRFDGRKFEDVTDDEFVEHIRASRTTVRSAYLENLAKWRRHYPPERFEIGFFEELSEDPKGLLLRVFRLVGASTDVDWESFPYSRVINSGEKRPIPPAVREVLVERFRDMIEELYREFGEPVARWRV